MLSFFELSMLEFISKIPELLAMSLSNRPSELSIDLARCSMKQATLPYYVDPDLNMSTFCTLLQHALFDGEERSCCHGVNE